MSKIATVKLQSRKTRSNRYIQYLLTLPTAFTQELGWQAGETLVARVMELQIDGINRKVVVYYKP